MWYTRDDNGDRALWSEMPEKSEGGMWWTSCIGACVIDDANIPSVDAILGKGFHGLRKGGIAEISIKWNRLS